MPRRTCCRLQHSLKGYLHLQTRRSSSSKTIQCALLHFSKFSKLKVCTKSNKLCYVEKCTEWYIPRYLASFRYKMPPLVIPRYFSDSGIPRFSKQNCRNAKYTTRCNEDLSIHSATTASIVHVHSSDTAADRRESLRLRSAVEDLAPVWLDL